MSAWDQDEAYQPPDNRSDWQKFADAVRQIADHTSPYSSYEEDEPDPIMVYKRKIPDGGYEYLQSAYDENASRIHRVATQLCTLYDERGEAGLRSLLTRITYVLQHPGEPLKLYPHEERIFERRDGKFPAMHSDGCTRREAMLLLGGIAFIGGGLGTWAGHTREELKHKEVGSLDRKAAELIAHGDRASEYYPQKLLNHGKAMQEAGNGLRFWKMFKRGSAVVSVAGLVTMVLNTAPGQEENLRAFLETVDCMIDNACHHSGVRRNTLPVNRA